MTATTTVKNTVPLMSVVYHAILLEFSSFYHYDTLIKTSYYVSLFRAGLAQFFKLSSIQLCHRLAPGAGNGRKKWKQDCVQSLLSAAQSARPTTTIGQREGQSMSQEKCVRYVCESGRQRYNDKRPQKYTSVSAWRSKRESCLPFLQLEKNSDWQTKKAVLANLLYVKNLANLKTTQ